MKEANKIVKVIVKAFKQGNKLLLCGNGGSAAMSQHIAAELVGKYKHVRRPLPAIALTTDTSILTAWSNDYSFDTVFERQVQALGKKGDVLLALSTSGKSENVLRAMRWAKFKNMKVIDVPRKGRDTPRIQEYQLKLLHRVCEAVEKEFL